MDPFTGWIAVMLVGGAFAGINALWQEYKVRRRQVAKDAKALLEERFAKGDIGEEEFARRMSLLTYGPPLVLPPSIRED